MDMEIYEKLQQLMHNKRMIAGFASNSLLTSWIKKQISLIENDKKDEILNELKRVVEEINTFKTYLSKIRKKVNGVMVGEAYLLYQKYFFYNEIFNYGFFHDILERELMKEKDPYLILDELTKIKPSYMKIKVLNNENTLNYEPKNLNKSIVEKYVFLVEGQNLLQEIYEKIDPLFNKLFEKFKKRTNVDLKQKAVLYHYVENAKNLIESLVLDRKYVLYKKYLFDIKDGIVYNLKSDEYNILYNIVKKENLFHYSIIIIKSLEYLKHNVLAKIKKENLSQKNTIFVGDKLIDVFIPRLFDFHTILWDPLINNLPLDKIILEKIDDMLKDLNNSDMN